MSTEPPSGGPQDTSSENPSDTAASAPESTPPRESSLPSELPSKYADPAEASRIYFLPNLMTAGNLFCGFVAIIRCIQAKFAEQAGAYADFLDAAPLSPDQLYAQAVYFILAAVVFDILDGRLARLGGRESLFGKEFDSIADVVSFGVAPAMLVFFLILSPTEGFPIFRQLGWALGFVYLLCAAVRLARFNVITHPSVRPASLEDASSDFVGLPVPAAAGMIASLVLVLINYEVLTPLTVLLPALMLLIAILMVSNVPYPSFKYIDWSTELRFRTFIGVALGIAALWLFKLIGIALLFQAYLFYGLFRYIRLQLRARREARVS